MALSLAPTSAAGIGKTLGLSQGGAPSTVLGYAQTPAPPPPAPSGPDWNAILAQIRALQAPPPPRVSQYDFGAANARARSMAESAVNPLYAQKLNLYLEQEATQKQRAHEDFTTQNTQLDEVLKNALDLSGITKARTAEDTTTKLSNIGQAEGAFQHSDAGSFGQARDALMGNLATSGLTGSGLGQQRIQGATDQRNYESGLKETDFGNQKQATNLFQTRTFEDLARSDMLAGQQTGEKKQAVQVSLDRSLQDLAQNEAAKRDELESQRMSDILGQQLAYQKQLGQQWLQGLAGKVSSRDFSATASAFGGLF